MDNILDAREKRDAFEASLIQEYGHPLITVRANYPGPVKGNLFSNYAAYRMLMNLRETFDILAIRHTLTAEGLIFFLIVEGDGADIKRRCLALEDGRQLGRLLDIDVREDGRTWSRTDLDFERRRCFLCKSDAVLCVRSMRHRPEEVRDFFRQTVEGELLGAGLRESLNRLTAFALVNELCRAHGYGCVTVNGTGAHGDMDFMTFIESIGALSTHLGDLLDVDVEDFGALRAFGLRLEEEMLRRTGGVNTHRGAIFTLVLLLAGFLRSTKFSEIRGLVAETARPALEDFESDAVSHGLSLYRTHGIRGIRESAAAGFPNVFETYLPFFERHGDLESLSLLIMSMEEDTTVIHRGGPHALEALQEKAALLLEEKDAGERKESIPPRAEEEGQPLHRDEEDCQDQDSGEKEKGTARQALSDWCVEKNISTGGSADILSATVLLWMLKKHYHHLKGEI